MFICWLLSSVLISLRDVMGKPSFSFSIFSFFSATISSAKCKQNLSQTDDYGGLEMNVQSHKVDSLRPEATWLQFLTLNACQVLGGNPYIDGLLQDCSISIANALEILESCNKPSTYSVIFNNFFGTEMAHTVKPLI